MNKLRVAAFALVLAIAPALTASAQAATEKKPMKMDMMDMDHEEKTGWKELDAFHALMAASWHPAAMSNDLKPAREKAVAMSDAAQAWAESKTPTACDTKKIHGAMAAVATGAKAIAASVTKATDTELKASLKQLHDHFEVAEMNCKPTPAKK